MKLPILNWITDTGRLLLPVIVPSWRFFDEIAPSPRIEFSLSPSPSDQNLHWQAFRPRPDHVSVSKMLRRMVWNPHWNENLFLMSCAERLMSQPTQHSEDEIFERLMDDLRLRQQQEGKDTFVAFRLVFLYRYEGKMHSEVTYTSKARRMSRIGGAA